MAGPDAVYDQVLCRPEIGLHQNPQRVIYPADSHNSGSGSDSPLQAVAHSSRACAHITLLKILTSTGKCLHHILHGHSPVLDTVNSAVITLTHNRAYGCDLHLVLFALPDGILHQGVGYQPHVQGIGQGNGRLQGSQLLHLDQTAGLAEPIVHISRSDKLAFKYISRSRHNDRDAGFVVPISHCLMAY